MTTADRIRAAALGPTPECCALWLYGWLGYGTKEHKLVKKLVLFDSWGVSEFSHKSITETERRMFLLFVAEALGSDEQKTSEDQP